MVQAAQKQESAAGPVAARIVPVVQDRGSGRPEDSWEGTVTFIEGAARWAAVQATRAAKAYLGLWMRYPVGTGIGHVIVGGGLVAGWRYFQYRFPVPAGPGITRRLADGTGNVRAAFDNYSAAASAVRNMHGRPAGQPGVGWQTDFYGAKTVNAEAVKD